MRGKAGDAAGFIEEHWGKISAASATVTAGAAVEGFSSDAGDRLGL